MPQLFARLQRITVCAASDSHSTSLVGLAVTTVPLLPVANNLEAADDLADGEETKDLSGDDTSAPVLCARCAADLVEDGVGVHRVGERGGVAEGVERGLEVALDGLDGAADGLAGGKRA